MRLPFPRKFDVDAWFARLDSLGARNFLAEGPPEGPPPSPEWFAPTPWDAIDALGASPFMLEGRNQPAANDKPIFES
jgi:hypothetical protein